jgi:hypothetical protein
LKYKENHYVPCWYQERFLPASGERKFRYLDLAPKQFRDPNGILRTKTALRRWGAASCNGDFPIPASEPSDVARVRQVYSGPPSSLSAQRAKDM